MGIFDADWQRLHKKLSRDYELIALKNYESGASSEVADVFAIIAEIVNKNVPNLSYREAADFVEKEYRSFQNFDVHASIAHALRRMNPNIPETGIFEIFEAIRRCFHNP